MLPFAEERLELGFDYGAEGGPEFATDIVVMASGHEARNQNWSQARGRWQAGERIIGRAKKDYLLAFFRARRGRLQGFRFKDWSDWYAVDEPLAVTGGPAAQLIKAYQSGADADIRLIKKPRAGVTLKRGGMAYATPTVDTTTGQVTFLPDTTAAIAAITQANPGKVTAPAHGLANGALVYLTGIGGMTQLNGRIVTVTVVDADNFTIGIDTTAYAAYTAGGSAAKYPQPGETITWSGEFDVPARFDTDRFIATFRAYRESDGEALYDLASLPVVEIRV